MQVSVTVSETLFNVDVHGTITGRKLGYGVLFDEVRLAAAERFCNRKDLTHDQREYWAAVKATSKGKQS